ncbi:MAG: 4Fe-4S binding protein [Chloroflexi bacterium]|nr:4Fe-4S binding protein [Chloroflexota bacterium]
MGVETTGILIDEELAAMPGVPSEARLAMGKVAVIECGQQIPCNPCEDACRFGAIVIGEPLTRPPALIEDKCTGCGLCLPVCPGLAIFLVDTTYSDTEAAVSFPYEMLPQPRRGQRVQALDRAGEVVGEARVISVQSPRRNNRTPIVTVAVPKAQAMVVRNIAWQE